MIPPNPHAIFIEEGTTLYPFKEEVAILFKILVYENGKPRYCLEVNTAIFHDWDRTIDGVNPLSKYGIGVFPVAESDK